MGSSGPERHYEAVTLDLFGTLLDFQSILVSTLQRIMVDNDLTHMSHALQERMRAFTFEGMDQGSFVTVREDFERALVAVLEDLDVVGDVRSYASEVLGGMFEQVRHADLYPEIPPVIDKLEAAGVPWGIVSNVDEDDMLSILSNHDLRPSVAVSSERVASYKPDVHIFKVALKELEMGSDKTLHAGDSPIADVAGAHAAGVDSVWVNRFGVGFPSEILRPRYELPDLSSLPALVVDD